jgi:antitoxin component of MazEF toxin-antitoxin module
MEAGKIQRVIKVGDSLAVVLPKYLTRALLIERGDAVMLSSVQTNEVRVRKLSEQALRDMRLGFIE